jgi:hypothetical protein
LEKEENWGICPGSLGKITPAPFSKMGKIATDKLSTFQPPIGSMGNKQASSLLGGKIPSRGVPIQREKWRD